MHLNGTLVPQRGSLKIGDFPLTKDTVHHIRRTVGMVFQDSDDQLFMPTVFDDVAFGPLNLGFPKEEIEDIDLGKGMDGTCAAMEILKYRDIPIVFQSSHTEKEIVDRTEKITSYGYIVKHSGLTILDASIKMAFRLHNAYMELKEKEDSLRKSEENYRILVENLNTLVCETDNNGRYIYVSPSYKKITGYSQEELLGKMVIEHLHPDDLKRWGERFCNEKFGGKSIKDIWRFKIKNGEWRWFDCSVSFYERSPANLRAVVISNDITERVLEKERMEQIIQENELYFNEMKTRVSSTASIIRGFVDFLINQFKDDESKKIFLRANNRIQFCLDLYETFHCVPLPQKVTLHDFIANIINSIQKVFVKAKHAVLLSDDLKEIFIDIKWILPIGFILNEILSNAMVHAYPDKTGVVYVSGKKIENAISVVVEDHGVGMDSLNEKSSGMGFNLIHRILDEINATFKIVSDGGTRAELQFYI